MEHQWVEPAGEEAPRPPDVWRFTVPARLTATVALTEEMEGVIAKAGGSEVGRVPPGRSWTGALEPGVYELAAVCSRRNNLVSYEVTVSSRELVAGLTRKITAPASVPVAVGPDGLIELASVAQSDVRAQLLDSAGHVVAEGDDRPDGWDFLLFQRLPPGSLHALRAAGGHRAGGGEGDDARRRRGRGGAARPAVPRRGAARRERAAPPAAGRAAGRSPARGRPLEGQPGPLRRGPGGERLAHPRHVHGPRPAPGDSAGAVRAA